MKTSTILAVASAHLASATFGWLDAPSFRCPGNTNNHCSPQQSTGFDWGSLNLGSFSSYSGFEFSGFSCASDFGKSSKRDILTGRTFQKKCITGSASSDASSSPKFGCGSSPDVDAFSVSDFQISVEFDTDLEFHYGMSDGSTCKHKSHCRAGGSQISNSQCGGAKSVTVVYPSPTTGPKSTCSIGIHSIGFHCSSSSSTVVRTKTTQYTTVPASETEKTTTTSKSKSKSTKPASSEVTSTSSVGISTSTSPSTAAQSTTSSTAEASTSTKIVGSTTESITESSTSTTPTAFTTSTIFTTIVSTVISCAPTVTNCPAHSTQLTTVTVALSTTICPVTETSSVPGPPTSTAAASTSSSVVVPTTFLLSSATSTYVPASSAPVSSPTTSSTYAPPPLPVETSTAVIVLTSTTLSPVTVTHTAAGSTSYETQMSTSTVIYTTSIPAGPSTLTTASPPAPTAPCPDVLPQCLSTWMFTVGCKDNTDSNCYCPSSDFVSVVFGCLSAHGVSGDEISQAQTYFQGICAPHIPSNPAIVTGASSVTGSSGATITAAPAGPVTTLQILTTVVVPYTESTGISAGYTIPSSSITTTISAVLTVPQVVFSTVTAAGGASPSAALVAGTPAAVQAVTTAAVGYSSYATNSGASATGMPGSGSGSVPFTGAASKGSVAVGSFFIAMVVAVLAL